MDDPLLAGFDRADIDAVAEANPAKRIGDIPVPAPDPADVTEAPREGIYRAGGHRGNGLPSVFPSRAALAR